MFALVLTKKAPATRLRGRGKIRCPKCAWEPEKSDRWRCEPGCGHVWNTFETHGLCPGCSKQWTDTKCLRCSQWSAHDEWYVSGETE